MFRKAREAPESGSSCTQQSVGRPPTPPLNPAKTPFTLAVPQSIPPPKMALTKTRSNKEVPLPVIGRQGPSGAAKKPSATPKGKDKANGNIMNFFKSAEEAGGLFVQEKSARPSTQDATREEFSHLHTPSSDETLNATAANRFNECADPVKRRRTSPTTEASATDNAREPSTGSHEHHPPKQSTITKAGPFFEESDSEQDEEQPEALIGMKTESEDADDCTSLHIQEALHQEVVLMEEPNEPQEEISIAKRPPLIKEETSFGQDMDDFRDFEGMDDFDEHAFEGGDEFMERRYMEEQALLEAEADEKDYDAVSAEETPAEHSTETASSAPACPICNISLDGVSEQDAGVHVNSCLDGNPTPLPGRKAPLPTEPVIKQEQPTSEAVHPFRRPYRPPKPAQASPFTFGQPTMNGGSAFNKLMSGNAEDMAWAEAAASEHASRGKPSYTRTCPFYKIMPGLFICVDAFRYGAVAGCQAYFLSHFHSDHYVGLTSSWRHGPIYCSRVTGNLVRQQLRVDPKYVVDLEFEKTVEVPGTKGVMVTMISANHCPGSSLYLFEKTVGKKTNGESKTQRILHCGDFRACRMHVEHPLLMPDIQDKVTGKSKEQKIDVCYLDTTYLNPKYAFPSQQVVTRACADMCVSLSKHSVDESDGWEQMKRLRAGEGMVKFVRKESNPEIKEEATNEDDTRDETIKLEKNPNGSQQNFATSVTPNVQQGRGRLLVVVGTYSIGKERICLGIAKALDSKIYAPPSKQRIVAALEDPELDERMTNDPRAAQVHMTPLFEIRAETLDDYLKDHYPHFTRAVGFRPSGWNYRPPNSRFTESPAVQTVLHSDNWKSTYNMRDLVPQRGSTSRTSCFGVPYSEHSSFRELTMFCCALRIEKIIPTVNVGSKKGRERMKGWCERWAAERKKNGVVKLGEDAW